MTFGGLGDRSERTGAAQVRTDKSQVESMQIPIDHPCAFEGVDRVVEASIEDFRIVPLGSDPSLPSEGANDPDIQHLAKIGVEAARWTAVVPTDATAAVPTDAQSERIQIIDHASQFVHDAGGRNPMPEGERFRLYLDGDNRDLWGAYQLLHYQPVDEEPVKPPHEPCERGATEDDGELVQPYGRRSLIPERATRSSTNSRSSYPVSG